MIPKFFFTDKFIYIVLCVVVFAIYANSLGNDFVSDDRGGLLFNPKVGDWGFVFRSFIGWGTAVTRLVIFHTFGLQAWAYRLFNIIIHIGSACAVYYLFRNLYNKQLGILTAFLFALHPILTESITWIAGTAYALYGLLFLVSFILFLESEDKYNWKYYLSLVLYLLAILTSEKAVSLAGVYILYKFIYSNESKATFLKSLSYLGVSAIFIILLVQTLGKRNEILATEYYQEGGYTNPFYQVPIAVAEYIKLYVWPQALTLYHSETVFSYGEYAIRLVVFLAFIIPALVFMVKSRGGLKNTFQFWKNVNLNVKNPARLLDYKYISFWALFFIVCMLPTLTPLKVSWIVAERYAYIAVLGFAALIAYLLYKALNIEQIRIAVIGIFIFILFALGIRTIYRNTDWYNEDTLWFATVKYSPSSPNIYNNLGDVFSRRGEYDKAIENFKYATVVKPNYADAYHNLAYTYQLVATNEQNSDEKKKLLDLAEENYQNAIKYNPNLWQSMQNLALVHFEEGNIEQGYKDYQAALQKNPNDLNLYVSYISVNLQLKNYDEAEKTALYLLSVQPDNPELQNILTQVRNEKAKNVTK